MILLCVPEINPAAHSAHISVVKAPKPSFELYRQAPCFTAVEQQIHNNAFVGLRIVSWFHTFEQNSCNRSDVKAAEANLSLAFTLFESSRSLIRILPRYLINCKNVTQPPSISSGRSLASLIKLLGWREIHGFYLRFGNSASHMADEPEPFVNMSQETTLSTQAIKKTWNSYVKLHILKWITLMNMYFYQANFQVKKHKSFE